MDMIGGRQRLFEALRRNDTLWESLRRLPALRLPDWFLGAGCIAQTVWNHAHGRPPADGILDYDLVYFDPDRSEAAEERVIHAACQLLEDLQDTLDDKNQARVHLWYGARFGIQTRPYVDVEDAIGTWPTTASAVGVRLEEGGLRLCAPFGLDDLFGLVVRANRVQVTREIYEAKVDRWSRQWPMLQITPWEDGVGEEGSRFTESL
jgi:uncharacterized protein